MYGGEPFTTPIDLCTISVRYDVISMEYSIDRFSCIKSIYYCTFANAQYHDIKSISNVLRFDFYQFETCLLNK